MDIGYIVIAALVTSVFVGMQLVRKFPRLKAYLPYIAWFARLLSKSFEYFKFKKAYQDPVDLAYRYSVLLNLLAFSSDSRKSKEWVNKFVSDTYVDVLKYSGDKDDAVRVSSAVWALLSRYPLVIDTIKGLGDHKNLDVKKATLIAIDVLGELVNMSDKLDVLFFQNVIYGINKALIEIRDSASDKERVSKVSATLWRLYQITLAYKNQKDLTGITKEQFYKQVATTIGTMYKMFTK